MTEDNYKIILQGPELKSANDPSQKLVIVEWYKPDGTVKEYSRHTLMEDGALYSGHYHMTKEEAIQDMEKAINLHDDKRIIENLTQISDLKKWIVKLESNNEDLQIQIREYVEMKNFPTNPLFGMCRQKDSNDQSIRSLKQQLERLESERS